jgi:carbon monoxide dehydrogenase subunit G
MKNKISKASAALAIAVAAVFAAPAVASASTNGYTPDPVVVSAPGALTPGAPGTVSFTDFAPNEGVTFTLTGENASGATLAFVAFAVESTSVTKDADSEGNASVEVTLPENASGSYELTATGQESGTVASTTIQVAATGSGTGTDGGNAGGGGVLQNTGFDGDALLGLWVGGGVLVLAGASIAVATSVRRARRA